MRIINNAVGGGWGWFVELGSTDCLHSFDNHHRMLHIYEEKQIRIHVHCLTRVARQWWVGWGCYVCKVIIVGRNNFVDVTILTDAS